MAHKESMADKIWKIKNIRDDKKMRASEGGGGIPNIQNAETYSKKRALA